MSKFISFGSSVASLTKRSNKIFDVFTQTQKDCEKLNTAIDGVVSTKSLEIAKLQDEVSSLNAVKTKNTNLSNKIGAFINS